jgi:hypothetical protein
MLEIVKVTQKHENLFLHVFDFFFTFGACFLGVVLLPCHEFWLKGSVQLIETEHE